MQETLKKDLQLGLADACGFVLGAIAGWQTGLALGFDFLGSTEWGTSQLIGLALILLGCGLGRWVCRGLLARFGGSGENKNKKA